MDELDFGSPAPTGPAGQAQNTTTTTGPTTTRQIDPAIALANKNIEELNNIDEKISSLLLSAGLAIKALTTPTSQIPDPSNPSPPLPTTTTTTTTSSSSDPQPTSIPTQLTTFKSHATTFFVLLDSIRVLLRRQILLQEQAEILAILPPNATAPSAGGAGVGSSSGGGGGAGGGGAGGFDLGLLNVRSDAVEKDMEAELWAKARMFVDGLMARAREDGEAERQLLAGGGGGGGVGEEGDVVMGS
ncbi:mediator complex protein-domain-containing protein [Peziza echinospora]|nr:mediator complex protein-domain-containing protein [Peziza echinospora]